MEERITMKITEKELKKIIVEETRKSNEAIRPNRSFKQLQPPSGLSWDDVDVLLGIHKHLATVSGGGGRADMFAGVLQKLGVNVSAAQPSADPAPDAMLQEKINASDIRDMVAEEINKVLKEGTSIYDMNWSKIDPEIRSKPGMEELPEETLKAIVSKFCMQNQYTGKAAWDEDDVSDNIHIRYGSKHDEDGYDLSRIKSDIKLASAPSRRSSSWADDGDFEQSKYDRNQRKRDSYWGDVERQQKRRGY